MKDGIIKATGNSRYLKSVANFLTLYPDYETFAAALVEGTLPIDLNGLNDAGWEQKPTLLNKANLLDDTTASKLGLTGDPTVNQALAGILRKPIQATLTVSGWTAVTGGYTQSVAVAGLLTTDDTRTRVDPVRSESGSQANDEAFSCLQEPGAYVGCRQNGYLYCRVVNKPTAAIKLQVTIGR